jgi:O-antigen ligase
MDRPPRRKRRRVLSLERSREDHVSLHVRARRAGVLDTVGVGLFVAAGCWMLWTSLRSGGSAAPGIRVLLICGLVLVVVRTLGPRARLIVPAACLVAAVIVAARSKTGILTTAPLSGPLEYVNADGAFYVQAAIAGLMLAYGAGSRPRSIRALGAVGAGLFAVLPFIVHAVAAAWLVVVLPGIALLSVAVAGARGTRAAVAVCGLLFASSLAATMWLGSSYRPTGDPSVLQRAAIGAVSEQRLRLWHDAFVIMRSQPVTGVGPGRYQVVSPIASRDPDSRWAHNEFLQQGAEGGIAGLGLLALIFLWGFFRLGAVMTPGPITALSAPSLAALGIHACFDYVMHFAAIPVMAAALVATGAVDGRSRSHQAGWAREQAQPAAE